MTILYRTISNLVYIVKLAILARIILSFLNIRSGIIFKIIYEITEPILLPARLLLNKLGLNAGFLDLSPIIAVLILDIVDRLAIRLFL